MFFLWFMCFSDWKDFISIIYVLIDDYIMFNIFELCYPYIHSFDILFTSFVWSLVQTTYPKAIPGISDYFKSNYIFLVLPLNDE